MSRNVLKRERDLARVPRSVLTERKREDLERDLARVPEKVLVRDLERDLVREREVPERVPERDLERERDLMVASIKCP
jgi:hypothetical protein